MTALEIRAQIVPDEQTILAHATDLQQEMAELLMSEVVVVWTQIGAIVTPILPVGRKLLALGLARLMEDAEQAREGAN